MFVALAAALATSGCIAYGVGRSWRR